MTTPRTKPFTCRICGKGANEIKAYLARCNPTGETPAIWECVPSCEAVMSPDDRLIAALEADNDHTKNSPNYHTKNSPSKLP